MRKHSLADQHGSQQPQNLGFFSCYVLEKANLKVSHCTLVCLCIEDILFGKEAGLSSPFYHESKVFFQTCERSEFWGSFTIHLFGLS
jgi:hypothetical protein